MGEHERPAPDLAEIRRTLNAYRRQQRLDRLARGEGKPRTRAETEVWWAGVRERHGLPADEQGGGDDV